MVSHLDADASQLDDLASRVAHHVHAQHLFQRL